LNDGSNMKLKKFLIKKGYTPFPFVLNELGHPKIEAAINKIPGTFLVDTGAAGNVIDAAFAGKIGLSFTDTGIKGGGVGGIHLDVFQAQGAELSILNIVFKGVDWFVMDLSEVKKGLQQKGDDGKVEGIIGFSVFKKYKAVIDYKTNLLFLKIK
jgi:hypothetical protein